MSDSKKEHSTTTELLLRIAKAQEGRIKLLESRLSQLERECSQADVTINRMREIFRQQGYSRI